MYEVLGLVPGCLIQVEGVLLELSVKGDNALLIEPVCSSLVSAVNGEVEHVPHVGSPQPGMALDAVQNVLVIYALILL